MKRHIEIIEVNAPWEPEESEPTKSKEYKEFIKENVENYAISHLEGWDSRYEGMSLSEIRFDLDVNYDLAGEVSCIEDIYMQETGGSELTQEEEEFTMELFVDTVIKEKKKELEDLLG